MKLRTYIVAIFIHEFSRMFWKVKYWAISRGKIYNRGCFVRPLGNFPRAPFNVGDSNTINEDEFLPQHWTGGKGQFFPTFETKVVGYLYKRRLAIEFFKVTFIEFNKRRGVLLEVKWKKTELGRLNNSSNRGTPTKLPSKRRERSLNRFGSHSVHKGRPSRQKYPDQRNWYTTA